MEKKRDKRDNLLPGKYKFTAEDHEKARQVKHEKAEQRKAFRNIFNAMLGKEVKYKHGEKLTVAEAIAMKQIENALKGDPKAFEIVRDTSGQKPVDKIEIGKIDRNQSLNELKEVFDDDASGEKPDTENKN